MVRTMKVTCSRLNSLIFPAATNRKEPYGYGGGV